MTTATASNRSKYVNPNGARETVEAIVVAFVLALSFRAFLAEAFIIPTGSMAPTLLGRHKEITCSKCGVWFNVGASDEMDRDGGRLLLMRITRATCPNCSYEMNIKDSPVFKGDRIIVNKFPFELGDPQRWDVVVFRYPNDPETNYIKRLVGLPNESIRLSRGDLFTRIGTQGAWKIARKDDPLKQSTLQMLVYDDAHPPRELLEKGWPERWAPMVRDDFRGGIDGWAVDESRWKRDAEKRTLGTEPTLEPSWIRYRHLVPGAKNWEAVERNQPPAANPQPQLITDNYGYNSFQPRMDSDDKYWVGDLTVHATIEIQQLDREKAQLIVELLEGVRRYQAVFDPHSGKVTLTRNEDLGAANEDVELATAHCPLQGSGTHRVTFANVDDQLRLWVDGSLVKFSNDTTYDPPAVFDCQPTDLSPVGIAFQGVGGRVSNLLLQRDIYYRAQSQNAEGMGEQAEVRGGYQLSEKLIDPTAYAKYYRENSRVAEFEALSADEFFMMGDNSQRSSDSRLWPKARGAAHRHAVPRQALVGQAFMVYWPHGVPFMNNGKGYPVFYHDLDGSGVENYPAVTFPFYPYLSRMRRIR